MDPTTRLPLAGVRVLDAATLFAGPGAATLLGDFGADVIKIEHPAGDPARRHGAQVHGESLWWKLVGRNKRTVTLDLSRSEGQEICRELVRDADVLVENFRPGTFERWGLGYRRLSELNPGLVMLRVSGFGRVGPMRNRAGFGTLAEAMSGFAHCTGAPDGPPTLPPFGLADGAAAVMSAYATMVALHARGSTGRGQVVDTALIEPILHLLGPQISAYQQLGTVQERSGNRSPHNAPRNIYRCRDGRWLAVSTSAQSIAERVMRLVGSPHLIEEPWFATGSGRAEHVEELDAVVGDWIAARDADEVIAAFEEARAAVAPVYTAADIVADPQFAALGTVVHVDDAALGPLAMQGVPARLSDTPGRVRWAGRPLGADNDEVFAGLGIDARRRAQLRREGVI
ncbi:formyl-CoA transferase [Streptomyces sp. 3211.6]|uniref:CaiB/BaiF CoA transferase family protein n=1 Tax=Streptomyces sp. 3211.6 TaxID=1938845 RepID=UPI000EB087ED|nr:CoA transferase [Streptomyces sp. 3211.6]RKT07843.1 formyl-CoA transferase [Streptomyces sp. 3211.6]